MCGRSYSGSQVIPTSEPLQPGPSTADRKPEALQGLHILIVDDEADARTVVRAALETNGAAVTEVDRVVAALELLTDANQPRRFDALVSDIAMPERDGYGLVIDLRAWERPRALRIPALAVSGHTDREDLRRALACGFDRHLPKPIEVEQLVGAIRELAFRTRRTH